MVHVEEVAFYMAGDLNSGLCNCSTRILYLLSQLSELLNIGFSLICPRKGSAAKSNIYYMFSFFRVPYSTFEWTGSLLELRNGPVLCGPNADNRVDMDWGLR